MTRWQYKTLKLETTGWIGGKFDAEELEELMNELGRDGWELAAAFDTNLAQGATREVVVLFKRPA